MLAGYLPFDDDPANPEGDNINLLYKYIVSTPLTFPEYVSPHARDLLRRILVPDPRKRADLFEVARHSWLSEYAHVVAHVTSSTTTITDIATTTVTQGMHASILETCSTIAHDIYQIILNLQCSIVVLPCENLPNLIMQMLLGLVDSITKENLIQRQRRHPEILSVGRFRLNMLSLNHRQFEVKPPHRSTQLQIQFLILSRRIKAIQNPHGKPMLLLLRGNHFHRIHRMLQLSQLDEVHSVLPWFSKEWRLLVVQYESHLEQFRIQQGLLLNLLQHQLLALILVDRCHLLAVDGCLLGATLTVSL